MIKIFDDIYWRGKLLVLTRHFQHELHALGKTMDFVVYVLEHGEHVLVSKRQYKYNVTYPYKRKYLCLSYVELEDIILIHIKPTRKK